MLRVDGGIELLRVRTLHEADAIESTFLYSLINGGPFNLPSALCYLNPIDPIPVSVLLGTDAMQPLLWNWYFVQVVNDPNNAAATTASGGWQRVTMQ